jgi:hypothetical protein
LKPTARRTLLNKHSPRQVPLQKKQTHDQFHAFFIVTVGQFEKYF